MDRWRRRQILSSPSSLDPRFRATFLWSRLSAVSESGREQRPALLSEIPSEVGPVTSQVIEKTRMASAAPFRTPAHASIPPIVEKT